MEPRDRIRNIRKSLGFTQTEFATRLGMKWYKIKDHELGRLKVTEELAQKINRVFGINYKWILDGESPKEMAWNEESIIATVNTGPFIDVYDSGIAVKIAQAKDTAIQQGLEYPEEPIKLTVPVEVYFHRVETINFAMRRANGICEECGGPAPFIRAKNNMPYLEAHHIKPISEGGRDEPGNIIMVCPNCHRKLHYG